MSTYHCHIISLLLILILAVCSFNSSAQQKYEKESRLKVKDVPAQSIQFVDAIENKGKVKWYKEIGLERTSVEAKFRVDGRKYSVEFDSLGNFEDVEIEVKWSGLNESLRKQIEQQLTSDCRRHRIDKVQIQYSGDTQVVLSKVNQDTDSKELTVRYEIVVRCTQANASELIEYLFSNEGKKISAATIVFKKSSNLEF